jgi:hypothetical protein
MATRRNRPTYQPDDLLRLALGAPLLWPGRTIRLERDSLLDCRGRSASAQVSVAELYHENSKLDRAYLPELVHTAVDAARFRQEFIRRRGLLAHGTGGEDPGSSGKVRALLEAACAADPELFYAIELRLVTGAEVYVYEPSAATFRLVKRLPPDQVDDLEAALGLLASTSPSAGTRAHVVILGCFPRNEVLLGPRGYRRTLIEVGRIVAAIMQEARRLGRSPAVRYEFDDREVDRLMEVDGVEESVVAAVELD